MTIVSIYYDRIIIVLHIQLRRIVLQFQIVVFNYSLRRNFFQFDIGMNRHTYFSKDASKVQNCIGCMHACIYIYNLSFEYFVYGEQYIVIVRKSLPNCIYDIRFSYLTYRENRRNKKTNKQGSLQWQLLSEQTSQGTTFCGGSQPIGDKTSKLFFIYKAKIYILQQVNILALRHTSTWPKQITWNKKVWSKRIQFTTSTIYSIGQNYHQSRQVTVILVDECMELQLLYVAFSQFGEEIVKTSKFFSIQSRVIPLEIFLSIRMLSPLVWQRNQQ
eukprot:TRINITY_DN8930_c0_g2_i6.p1 TRINITY_DN8930_c0_g2~~TRINITY_DN8930_c0_g2_i6.p1  ORF type:complete len:273 (-),score=-11.26 TRINITY_DN8930_c0_g2_i6:629-1447(-)